LIKRGGKETPYKFVTTVWSYRVLFLPYHFQSFLHSSRVYTFFVGAGCRLSKHVYFVQAHLERLTHIQPLYNNKEIILHHCFPLWG
jgi:hypothetical protein